METETTSNSPDKKFRQRVLLTNVKALIASTRPMSHQEKGRYYSRYRKNYPTRTHWLIPAIGRKLAYAALIALVGGVAVGLYNIASKAPVPVPTQINTTVMTENGQKSKIELPDGTEVWLNYGSKLSYNNQYGVTNREVVLTGEAFFDVKKNRELAFRVSTENLQVKVLGTRFNVEAYPGEVAEKVSLNEGSLEVLDLNRNFDPQVIQPGEMAHYSRKNQQLRITGLNVDKISAWKDGYLYFEKEPLDRVFAELKRKYDIDIEVTDSSVLRSKVTATIKDAYYADVFKSIAYSCKLQYTITNKNSMNERIKITISR